MGGQTAYYAYAYFSEGSRTAVLRVGHPKPLGIVLAYQALSRLACLSVAPTHHSRTFLLQLPRPV